MTGTNNEPFFQETKRIKRERFKWITLLITTNLLTAGLFLPSAPVEQKIESPWPTTWVEINIEAQILSGAKTPSEVTIVGEDSKVIFSKAYLISNDTSCSSFNQKSNARFMIAPEDLTKLSNQSKFKALPYSVELTKNSPSAVKPKRKYEIIF